MRIRHLATPFAAGAVLFLAGSAQAQSTVKALGIAIVDGGYADRAQIEQVYCPSTPGCLAGRTFYWSCSGATCTSVTPTLFSDHATKVARIAAKTARDHEIPSDPPVVFYSVVGDPEAYLAAQPTRIRVVVNTLGGGSVPPACAGGPAPPATVSVVRAGGNQGKNGFVFGATPPFTQGQIDCRPGVTSVSGTLAQPGTEPGTGVWVSNRTGKVCDLSNDNDPCSDYPFFINSNYSPLTTFGAEACVSTTILGQRCQDGSLIGTSFAAPVVGGAYLALYRRYSGFTPADVQWLLENATPVTEFTINTFPSPLVNHTFGVRIVTPATIQAALDSF